MVIEDSLVTRVLDFDRKFDQLIIDLASSFKDEIIKMNTDVQLFEKGELSTGKKIRPPYAKVTKAIKRKAGQPTNRVTLKDKGDFHDSIDLVFYDDRFEIISQDDKAKYLTARYTDDILGLNEIHLTKLREALAPLVRAEFLKLFA